MWKWMLFLLFSAYVALEVAVLLWSGQWLGLGWTLAWIVASSLLGVLMVRIAGLHALLRIHRKLREQVLPTQELLDMALILIGGCLLILPGPISDVVGLLLLLPPVRWFARAVFGVLYGDLLPAPYTPGSGAPPEDMIEIRAKD